jgi:hypothetical protein
VSETFEPTNPFFVPLCGFVLETRAANQGKRSIAEALNTATYNEDNSGRGYPP